MAIEKKSAVVPQLRALFHLGTHRELTDGQLLERFATDRGEAAERAFSLLVERHGAMVLRVCRSVLVDPNDAEDAFQATFLVLLAKARGLWVRESLGPWLHQVAYRTSVCSRSATARRRRHEAGAAGSRMVSHEPCADDLRPVLHEEIERLPERYRAPVVFCDLEGKSHEQAAQYLGWPVGTVKSRLSRGRERLRERLRRRGVAPGIGIIAAGLPHAGADLLIPPALVDSTTQLVMRSLALRGFVPGFAATLALEVLKVMALTHRLKIAATALMLCAVGTGVGVSVLAQKPKSDAPAAKETRREGTFTVQPGTLAITTHDRGLVEATSNQDIYSGIKGQTTILSIVPQGTKVTRGQLVVELDSASLKDQLTTQMIAARQAEAGYLNSKLIRQVAEIALVEYNDGIYPQQKEKSLGQIALAKAEIEVADSRLERTRRALERLQPAMNRAGGGTPTDIAAELHVMDLFAEARNNVPRAKFGLERAQTELMILDKYTKDMTVKKLKSDIETAKAAELTKESAASLEKSKEQSIQRQIPLCKIVSPGDGMVAYANDPSRPGTRQIEEGAAVRERQKILSVPDLSQPMRIAVKVHESEIKKIVPGLKANVRVDAFPDETLTGMVTAVAPFPDVATFETRDRRRFFTAHLKLDKGLPGLRPGMTADAEILLTQLENVLAVPREYVFQDNGKEFVAIRKADGGFERREITTGLSNGKSIEVKSGIKIGESLSNNF